MAQPPAQVVNRHSVEQQVAGVGVAKGVGPNFFPGGSPPRVTARFAATWTQRQAVVG